MATRTGPSKENEAPVAVAERSLPAHNQARKRQAEATVPSLRALPHRRPTLPSAGS